MDKFFANLTGKDDKKKEAPSTWQGGRSDMDSIKSKNKAGNMNIPKPNVNADAHKNIFANANSAIQKQMDKLNKPKASSSGGHSLGGSKPGSIYSISLSQPGSLGLEIEKRRDALQSAIVASVLPNSQADSAGLKRGDILCKPDESEYSYNEFLKLAKSGGRPLQFKIRRLESSLLTNDRGGSADVLHRKQAMIAAAEAREAKNKAYVKPLPKSSTETNKFLRPVQEVKVNEFAESNNAQTKQAVEAIKAVEKSDAENLGYNPYESRAMTGGQARVATVAMTAGEINADNAPSKLKGDTGASSFAESTIEVPIEFDYAFSAMVTSSSDQTITQKSLSTMRKLIINATTKGQADGEESAKFRRVRLTNPKIKEVIIDVQGALELMMAVGFVLSENEEDGETYLVYPMDVGVPDWLSGGLDRIEKYERGG
jgi:hypothetical protein